MHESYANYQSWPNPPQAVDPEDIFPARRLTNIHPAIIDVVLRLVDMVGLEIQAVHGDPQDNSKRVRYTSVAYPSGDDNHDLLITYHRYDTLGARLEQPLQDKLGQTPLLTVKDYNPEFTGPASYARETLCISRAYQAYVRREEHSEMEPPRAAIIPAGVIDATLAFKALVKHNVLGVRRRQNVVEGQIYPSLGVDNPYGTEAEVSAFYDALLAKPQAAETPEERRWRRVNRMRKIMKRRHGPPDEEDPQGSPE